MSQTRDYVRYTGPLPITEEAYTAFVGDAEEEPRIGVTYRMSLDDLIDCDGLVGMNDYLDAVVGAILSDIEYSIVTCDGQEPVILATGFIDRADWID